MASELLLSLFSHEADLIVFLKCLGMLATGLMSVTGLRRYLSLQEEERLIEREEIIVAFDSIRNTSTSRFISLPQSLYPNEVEIRTQIRVDASVFYEREDLVERLEDDYGVSI